MSKVLIAGVILGWQLLVPSMAKAEAEQFEVSNVARYTINTTGEAKVQHEIKIKNLTATNFIREYGFHINSNRIGNLTVMDDEGDDIPYTNDQQGGATLINILPDSPAVGRNQISQFFLSYDDPDVADKKGQVLEISVPKLVSSEVYSQYQVEVIVPEMFGEPTQVHPPTDRVRRENGHTILAFNKDMVIDKGAVITFGGSQIYEVTVGYPLENPSVTPIEMQVSLLPDTNYQKVYLERMEPAPVRLQTDEDGNWIATYLLEAKENLDVMVDMKVEVWSQPKTSQQELKPQDYLTQALEYWDLEAGLDEEIAKLESPEQIYDYIVNNFQYDYHRLDNLSTMRLGASKALQDPKQSLCLEFADAFIALARAKGIPARLVIGYAYSDNPEVRPLSFINNSLHAWAEYLDTESGEWKAVDPTWEATTGGIDYFHAFDTNHIAFVVRGKSSTKPYPGGILPSGLPGGAVKVNLAREKPQEQSQIEIEVKESWLNYFRRNQGLEIMLANKGNTGYYNESLTITDSTGMLLGQTQVPALIPQMKSVASINLNRHDHGRLSINYQNFKQPYESKYANSALRKFIWPITIALTLLAGGLLIYGAGHLLVQKRKR